MALVLYKPNKMNKGALVSIKFVAKQNKKEEDFKEGCFFINIIKQVSWNDQNHSGSFSGGESIGIKLSVLEASKILHVIERNWNLGDMSKMDRNIIQDQFGFTGEHGSKGQMTYINFVPWQRKDKTEQSGFGLFATKVLEGKPNSSFGVSFSFGEDIALREYIKLGLEHIYMASYAEDKRKFEENMDKKNGANTQSNPAPTPSTPRGRGRPSSSKIAAQDDGPSYEDNNDSTSGQAPEDDPNDSLF